MKTPKTIFKMLQAEYGDFGEYAALQQPYLYDGDTYRANAVTLDDIIDMREEGYTNSNGYPMASEAGYLEWEIINPESEDESHACDWDNWHYYDSYGSYVKSSQ